MWKFRVGNYPDLLSYVKVLCWLLLGSYFNLYYFFPLAINKHVFVRIWDKIRFYELITKFLYMSIKKHFSEQTTYQSKDVHCLTYASPQRPVLCFSHSKNPAALISSSGTFVVITLEYFGCIDFRLRSRLLGFLLCHLSLAVLRNIPTMASTR